MLPLLRPGEKPTDIHRLLTSWLTGHDPEDPFLRATFLSKMPGDLKKMLLARPDCTLAQLAAFADTIHSYVTKPPAVQLVEIVDVLGAAPDSLVQVCAVTPQAPSWWPAATAGRPAAASTAMTATGGAISGNGGYCWYHGRFGVNTRACKPGCTWQKNTFLPGQ